MFTNGESYAATQVLKGVITSGTGTAAGYGCPAAGKTGTAENYGNAWFVGYTPRLSTAVWVGYPQGNISMPGGFGGTLAAPIWHDFMYVGERRLLRGLGSAQRLRSPAPRSRAALGGERVELSQLAAARAVRAAAARQWRDLLEPVQQSDAVRAAAEVAADDGQHRRSRRGRRR